MPYMGLTPMEFAGAMVLGFVGLCAVCLALTAIGAYVIGRDIEEHRARRELRCAQERDERMSPIVIRLRAPAPEHPCARTHLREPKMLPSRRGDL